MRRREFFMCLGGAAVWPLSASAQQTPMPVIGVLGSPTAESYAPRIAAFKRGLKEAGFAEGQNLAIEFRWANDDYDRLPDMAIDLIHSRVSLIAAIGNNRPARAAKAATSTIPIVFAMGADPVQLGLVPSLDRPGGNITGVTTLAGDVTQKRLQVLHDLVPNAKAFGMLLNPDNGGAPSSGRAYVDLATDAVRAWGAELKVVEVRAIGDFDDAFPTLVEKRVDAIFTTGDSVFRSGEEQLIALATRYRLPMMFNSIEAPRAGGLASYTANIEEAYRQAGQYAGRILKGEKPGDLPVIQPTRFDLVINLKTAKALGLTVSNQLQLLADEVIE
jgi:putative ABC transport system substrate-binding protein